MDARDKPYESTINLDNNKIVIIINILLLIVIIDILAYKHKHHQTHSDRQTDLLGELRPPRSAERGDHKGKRFSIRRGETCKPRRATITSTNNMT